MTSGSEAAPDRARAGSAGEIRVNRDGAVATVLIDNPAHRNALTRAMWLRLAEVMGELSDDADTDVVVLRGAGGTFSAGAAIDELPGLLRDDATGRYDGGATTLAEDAVAACPKPTLAVVEGYCIGGAVQLLNACDIRLAADDARLAITPSKLGIVYPLSALERLVRNIGPVATRDLLFTGDLIDAATALRLGLLTRVVPRDRLDESVDVLVTSLCARSQLSIHATKELVEAMARGDAAAVERANERWQEEMLASGEPATGIATFLAKETPRFTWRRGG